MKQRSVTFDVIGKPEPKGSARAFVPLAWAKTAVAQQQQPRAVVTSDNPRVKVWEAQVAAAARLVTREKFLGPVTLTALFHLKAPKRLRLLAPHTTIPDLSKLIRSTEDALTGILFVDDAQIVAVFAKKVYAEAAPWARITVTDASPNLPEGD